MSICLLVDDCTIENILFGLIVSVLIFPYVVFVCSIHCRCSISVQQSRGNEHIVYNPITSDMNNVLESFHFLLFFITALGGAKCIICTKDMVVIEVVQQTPSRGVFVVVVEWERGLEQYTEWVSWWMVFNSEYFVYSRTTLVGRNALLSVRKACGECDLMGWSAGEGEKGRFRVWFFWESGMQRSEWSLMAENKCERVWYMYNSLIVINVWKWVTKGRRSANGE